MKIAFISAIPVVPAHEGNSSRILNLCRAVRALGHEVYFVFPQANPSDDLDREGHAIEFGPDKFVVLSSTPLERVIYLAKRALCGVRRKVGRLMKSDMGYYFDLDEFYGTGFDRKYKDLQRQRGFDCVICEYVFHSAALEAFPKGVRKILDTHDSFADRHKQFGDANYWFSVPPSEELRGFKRSDVVIAIQYEEAERFKRQINSTEPDVVVVSHMLDLTHKINDYTPSSAVFLGSGNVANISSVRYFIDQIMPRIRAEVPHFQLHLAGTICRKIEDVENVVKLGIVERVSDAFLMAPISLNPMLHGTGINIKLLDAMAAGVVTVSTQTGVRGLPDRFRSGVLAVPDDNPAEFAAQVVELLKDKPLRQAKGEAAYADAMSWNDAQKAALANIFLD